jgi:hypothetical protein
MNKKLVFKVLVFVMVSALALTACDGSYTTSGSINKDGTPLASYSGVLVFNTPGANDAPAVATGEATLPGPEVNVTKVVEGVAATSTPTSTAIVPANTSAPTVTPTPVVEATVQVVDLTGDMGPYDCKVGSDKCLTDQSWLAGRNAVKVVFFTKGKVFSSFMDDGAWSVHFVTFVNQMNDLGVYDVQAFGSMVDYFVGSPVGGFVAESNGAAIKWNSSEDRGRACLAWNNELKPIHPDWNFQDQYCH